MKHSDYRPNSIKVLPLPFYIKLKISFRLKKKDIRTHKQHATAILLFKMHFDQNNRSRESTRANTTALSLWSKMIKWAKTNLVTEFMKYTESFRLLSLDGNDRV